MKPFKILSITKNVDMKKIENIKKIKTLEYHTFSKKSISSFHYFQ